MKLSWSQPIVVATDDELATAAMRDRAEELAATMADDDRPHAQAMRAGHKVRKFGRTPRYGRDRGAATVGLVAAVALATASLFGGAAMGYRAGNADAHVQAAVGSVAPSTARLEHAWARAARATDATAAVCATAGQSAAGWVEVQPAYRNGGPARLAVVTDCYGATP